MPQPPGQSVFERRRLVIGRRLLVSGAMRMAKLADIPLVAMGWSNSHLHAFRVSDKRFGMNFDEFP